MKIVPRIVCLVSLLIASWTCRAALHPSLPPIGSLDGLGVNIHFTDAKPGEFEMVKAAGFKWVRMDLTWAATERIKGEYEFSAYDRLVAALEQHGLRTVFILDYGNPLYAESGDKHPFTSRAGTAEFREAFAKWAVAAVSRYKGKGYLWELWNEPNIAQFWKPKPNAADYIALANATATALREAGLIQNSKFKIQHSASPAAGEAVIGPATSTIDLAFLEECFKAGLLEHWAGVSVHPYRQKAPETVEEEYRSVRLLIRKYCPKNREPGDIPVLSGEWDYSSAWPSLGKDEAAREETQAKYLARMFLTNIANDVPLSIWYDWRDDGDDPEEGEHRFGLVRRQYHEGRDPAFDPKPAYQAEKTLMERLGGFRFNKDITEATRDFRYYHLDNPLLLFTRKNETRLSTWRGGDGNELVRVWMSPCELTVTTLTGATRILNAMAPDPVILAARDEVQYLTPTKSNALLQLAAAWKRLPLEYAQHAPSTVMIDDAVVNPLNRSVELPGWLNPDAVDSASVALHPPTIFDAKTVAENVEAARRKSLHKVEAREPVQRTVVRRIARVALQTRFGLRFDVRTDNMTATFYQHSFGIPTNPLAAQPLPPGDGFLPLRVRNEGGEPISGKVRAYADHDDYAVGAGEGEFNFAAGEIEKIVYLHPAAGVIGWGGNRLSFTSSFADLGIMALHPVIPLPHVQPEQYRVLTDGDPGVAEMLDFSPADPAGGRCPSATPSTRLRFRFKPGWGFLRVVPSADALNSHPEGYRVSGAEVGFWLHGDGNGCQARVRFSDSSGQSFQADGPKIDWKGWRYVTFPTQSTEEEPLTHWGGANDGKIHYPIKWDTIFLLDNVSREPVEGEIYLSAPTLIY